MNNNDRNQLKYIMSLSDLEFDNWATDQSDDDLQHAIKLIQIAREEIAQLENELIESDLSEANAVLKRFMLN